MQELNAKRRCVLLVNVHIMMGPTARCDDNRRAVPETSCITNDKRYISNVILLYDTICALKWLNVGLCKLHSSEPCISLE